MLKITQEKHEGSFVVLGARSWDGDFQLSDLDEQAFLRLHEAPLHGVRSAGGLLPTLRTARMLPVCNELHGC